MQSVADGPSRGSSAGVHELDVIVVGGGPAGSLLASLCRRSDPDRRVLMLERAPFPRHHVGESCSPGWHPILERAGVFEKLEASDVMRKAGVLFHWGEADDETWTAQFRDPSGKGFLPGSYQVDRAEFDRLLLDHARALGATVLQPVAVKAVERLEPSGFRVTWEDEKGATSSATTSFLVDASGQARLLARLFGLRVIPFDDMNNYAVYGYWKGSRIAAFTGPPIHERERWTYIAAAPDGWLWHIPTFPDLVSVGLVTDVATLRLADGSSSEAALEEIYLRNIRGAERVRDLLADAELVRHPLAPAKLLTARDWAYYVERTCGPGWFLVGDAAAFIDPILSSGLTIAAHGAALAANALHSIWTDPTLDEELLRESYISAYHDMASTYHRLARIWYSRNFKCDTWHWEARRQRLRTGRNPADETADDAFLEQCLGSFANPIEGSFGVLDFAERRPMPAGQVIREHLFRKPGEPAATPVHASTEEARRELQARTLARWRELLGRRISFRGATYREAESYFTDRYTARWERVRYAEIARIGATDRFERVIFPASNVVPLIADGARVLDVARLFCAEEQPGTSEHRERARLAQSQILQLDLHGFLAIDAAPDAPPLDWPAPLRAVARGVRLSLSVDLVGESLELTAGEGRAVLTPAEARSRHRPVARTATTAFAYRGDLDAVRPVLDRVVAAYRAWEAQLPDAAKAWWSRSFALAGVQAEIGPTP